MRSRKFRDSDYLEHIVNRIVRIERATSGVDLAGFLGNEDLQAAVERYIEVIGARNVIVHGYAEIEPDRIWDIVKSHIPSLGAAVGRLRQLINENGRAEPQRDAQSEEEPDRREDPGR